MVNKQGTWPAKRTVLTLPVTTQPKSQGRLPGGGWGLGAGGQLPSDSQNAKHGGRN